MSVPEQVPYKEYRATGSSNTFEITFYLPDPKDLVVMVNKEIPLVGAYSIVGDSVVFSTPPNEGDLVELTRDTQLDRETNFKSYDNSFRPETINFDLDKIWLVLQESNLVDAKILARLKQEIEWRRTHDFNYDELAQVREKQLFDALKGYTDTLNAATNPGVFQGVVAGVVFAQDGKSIQRHLEEILEALAQDRENIDSKADQTYVEEQLDLKANQDTTYSKTEVDSALDQKASKVDIYTKPEVDTTFAAYVGGRKAYKTLALAQADQASLPVNTAIEVTNDGANNGTYQWDGTTLTKSDYDPLTQAKVYADSNPLFKPKLLTSGQDILALSNAGYYEVSDGLIADSLINTPTQAKTKYGVYEVQIVAIYNIIIFRPYGRDTNFYVNSSQENAVWSGWQTFSNNATLDTIFASKALLNDTLSATIDALTQTKYFGKQYSESQLAGDLIYGGAIPYAGYAGVTTSAITFNSVVGRLWSKGAGDVEYRIFTGDVIEYNVNGALIFNNNINKHSYSGVITDFPQSDTGQAQTILLDKVVSITAATPFLIAFKNVNLHPFGLAFSESKIGEGDPQGFVSSSEATDWSSVAAISSSSSSAPYNLYQAGFQLKISTAEGGGGEPTIKHKPELVLPPKIYTLANLQAHIYPEHLLPEPHTEYLHTMSALRGNQTNRGWVWDVLPADGAGQMGFTWTVSDKQTGEPLSSASGLITIANKDVAGTKNVMVIGDSYVNAGVMTQRLLDIAATDPLKVNLIGTRTTGGTTNKHEGRPGWTIANYATNFAGNPFWIGGKVDFGQYLSANSLATPDVVFFELGVNDSFPMKTDDAVVALTATAFAQLDTIIASIKAQNPAVKIALLTPPSYANQDAFGNDYGSAYTSWRCNRNIVIWNRELIKRYKDSEPQNIYVVGSGYNVDTQANYPTSTQQVNSHNSNMTTVQSNSVHPADSGYKQIGDAMFAFMKAI